MATTFIHKKIPISIILICNEWKPIIIKHFFYDFHRESQNSCVTEIDIKNVNFGKSFLSVGTITFGDTKVGTVKMSTS